MLPRGFPFGLRRFHPPPTLLSAISSSVIVYKRHGFLVLYVGIRKSRRPGFLLFHHLHCFQCCGHLREAVFSLQNVKKTVKVSRECSSISQRSSAAKKTRRRCGKHELFFKKHFKFRAQDLSIKLWISRKSVFKNNIRTDVGILIVAQILLHDEHFYIPNNFK